MRAFQFRLERTLEWSRDRCAMEEDRLAACLRACDAVRQRLARLAAERETVDRETISRGTIAAGELTALGLYRLRVRQWIGQWENELQAKEKAAAEQRKVVETARRRVRLIEKLRERSLALYRQAEARELETLATESFLAKWSTGEEREWQRQRQH